MDSRAVCNFVCVLLCSVGVVVFAQDNCASLGQLHEVNRDCIGQTINYENFTDLNLVSQLGHMCRSEQTIRQCLRQNTTDCDLFEKLAVQKTINDSFFLCDKEQHDVSQWAKDTLKYSWRGVSCMPNFSNPPACKKDVDEQAIGFPYENKTVIDGLTAIAQLKRTFLSCWKVWLQETNCTQTAWRKTYLSFYISMFENTRLFGLNFVSVDKTDFAQVHAGLEEEQNTMSARDIFSIFS